MNTIQQKVIDELPKYKNGSKAIPKDEIVVQLSAVSSALTAQREESQKEIEDLTSALISMYEQYCSDGHWFMSAGEEASSVLERYGYSFDEAGRLSANLKSHGD